ncbi:MAG: dihydrofolate reductase [Bacteroidota bacterium]|nr:dihydrofolate reductase [Bacteroidota bacterium]
MRVSIIVAVSENGIIGKDQDLIWHLPKDIKFFKETTLGHHVIMGRKNFESIPHKYRPLPNRENIIITRNNNYNAEKCSVVNSIEDALTLAQSNGDDEPFIIGGGEIYKLVLENNLIDRIYLTRVHASFEGDTYFPKLSSEWKEISRINHKSDIQHRYDYSFLIYEKEKIS